jgi:hypothetical protein
MNIRRSVLAALALSLAIASAARAGELTRADLEAAGQAAVAETKGRPALAKALKNRKELSGRILLTPLIYDWGTTDEKMGYPPRWKHDDHTNAGYQGMVDSMQRRIEEGLKARGFAADGLALLAEKKVDLKGYGSRVSPAGVRDRAMRKLPGTVYAPAGHKGWDRGDFMKANKASEGAFAGAIFIRVYGGWDYDGHGTLEGEPVPVYHAMEWYQVSVCDASGDCVTQKVGEGKSVPSKRGLPSVKFENEAKREQLSAFLSELNAKTTADSLLHIVDAMLALKK